MPKEVYRSGRRDQNHAVPSIIGKLMYNMMKVGLELANSVRELTGQMVKPNKEHWNAAK